MQIRPVAPGDLAQIAAIYNEVIANSNAVYTEQPTTLEQRQQWMRAHAEQGYPILVAEEEGTVLGFACFSDFRPWAGYHRTVEGTIHLAPGSRRQGLGTALLDQLVLAARACQKHVLVAGVDSGNQASLGFLRRYGFEQVGTLREVGYKFGHFLDLVFLQYFLTSPVETNAE